MDPVLTRKVEDGRITYETAVRWERLGDLTSRANIGWIVVALAFVPTFWLSIDAAMLSKPTLGPILWGGVQVLAVLGPPVLAFHLYVKWQIAKERARHRGNRAATVEKVNR